MFGDVLQPTHLLFILIVALLVLGPKRLPEVGRALGNGLRDFKSAINGEHKEDREAIASEHLYDEPGSDQNHDSSVGHEFAHTEPKTSTVPGAPPATGEHQFAHETPPATGEHQFATETPPATGEHQFAHETAPAEHGAPPAEHRAEPPA